MRNNLMRGDTARPMPQAQWTRPQEFLWVGGGRRRPCEPLKPLATGDTGALSPFGTVIEVRMANHRTATTRKGLGSTLEAEHVTGEIGQLLIVEGELRHEGSR